MSADEAKRIRETIRTQVAAAKQLLVYVGFNQNVSHTESRSDRVDWGVRRDLDCAVISVVPCLRVRQPVAANSLSERLRETA